MLMPRLRRVALCLVVNWAHVTYRGATAARVVPGLDPLEHGKRQLTAGLPAVLVEELELQGGEALGQAVVVAVADGAQHAGGAEPAPERPARVLRQWGLSGDVVLAKQRSTADRSTGPR